MFDRLKSLRESRALTQQKVASDLGMSRQVYNNYELGKREPSYEVAKQLAEYFNTSVSYLVSETDDMSPPKTDDPAPARNTDIDPSSVRYAFHREVEGSTEEDLELALNVLRTIKALEREKKEQ